MLLSLLYRFFGGGTPAPATAVPYRLTASASRLTRTSGAAQQLTVARSAVARLTHLTHEVSHV